jgi:hypothetical protein
VQRVDGACLADRATNYMIGQELVIDGGVNAGCRPSRST